MFFYFAFEIIVKLMNNRPYVIAKYIHYSLIKSNVFFILVQHISEISMSNSFRFWDTKYLYNSLSFLTFVFSLLLHKKSFEKIFPILKMKYSLNSYIPYISNLSNYSQLFYIRKISLDINEIKYTHP